MGNTIRFMNKLKDWLDEKNGRRAELARMLSVPQSFVSKLASGERPIPIHHMAAIEVMTQGAVTRRDMRPEDFAHIWPELADTTATDLVRSVRASMNQPQTSEI